MKRNLVLVSTLFLLGLLASCNKQEKAVAAAPVAKESIVVAAAEEPNSLFPFDPSKALGMNAVPIVHNVYETPIKLMPDGSHEPLLATSWSISEDGKDYTLKLREDVYFHTGKKMTPEDVAFSLDSAAPTPMGRTMLVNYINTEVIDGNTVVVHLSAPFAPFLNTLAGRFALVVDKDYFGEVGIPGYQAAPIGTGPYKFIERISGDHITLAANENYWNGAPPIKKITYKFMTDGNTQMLALENGEADALLNANISQVVQLPKDGAVKWEATEASSIQSLIINCAKGPAADKNFRKALQHGINKQELILGVMEGMADPVDIFMAKSFSGRPDDGAYKTIPYDIEKAKEYLKASSYRGEEFLIVTPAGGKDEQAAQIVQGELIELGINCTLSALDAVSFTQVTTYGTGEFGAYIRAIAVSLVDADGLYVLYHSNILQTPNRYNYGVHSEKMDVLLDTGRTTTDTEKRKLIYAEASDIITEEAYQIMLYCNLSVTAYNKNLQGVIPRMLTGLYFFNDWHY
jgi:peptide/nickel transport system substrate-binding protein